jgi:hypothetical protein
MPSTPINELSSINPSIDTLTRSLVYSFARLFSQIANCFPAARSQFSAPRGLQNGGSLSATRPPRTPDGSSASSIQGGRNLFSFSSTQPPKSAPAAHTAITSPSQRQLRDEERTIVRAMKEVLERTHARLYDAFQVFAGIKVICCLNVFSFTKCPHT